MDIIRAAVRAALCACAVLPFLASIPAAQADTGVNTWTAQQIVAASGGTSRVLWTADSTTGLGKTASVWSLNAAGSATAYGPVYGHHSDSNGDWLPAKLAVAADGTTRLLWTNESASGQEVCVWTLNAAGKATSYGPTYGPFSDSSGDWHAQDLQVAPDGTTRLLWKYFGAAGVKAKVWSLDATGAVTVQGAVYGPLSTTNGSRYPQKLVVALDGTTRLLWTVNGVLSTAGVTSGDTITVWTLNAQNAVASYGTSYGPYAGWTVADFDVNPTTNTMPVLWYNTSSTVGGDTASVWTLNTSGATQSTGTAYGPYAGWSAVSLTAIAGGTSRVEWIKNPASYRSEGDTVTLWGFGSTGTATFFGPIYGGYSGYTLASQSVYPADGLAHLVWDRTDGASTAWSLGASGAVSAYGPVVGPLTY